MNIRFTVRQIIKMAVQHVLLPFVYRINKHKSINKHLILFADSHHDSIPYSMQYLHSLLKNSKWEIREHFMDYQGHSFLVVCQEMFRFMKDYANAGYVVICDNFLPVSSCTKRKETCVIQLWHAGGILKKYAYDTNDDIPAYYKGNVFKNYDITTVSSPICVPVYEKAMRLSEDSVYPIGLSRTDCFFDEEYLSDCRKAFFESHPEDKNRIIVLYAPTFRGRASDPYLVGGEWIGQLEEQLNATCRPDERRYKVYTRVHPHLDNKKHLSNIDIPTERLLPVIDVLISDVSSVIFDYVLLQKPLVLFIPDIEQLESSRGFYIPLSEIPGRLVTEGSELAQGIQETLAAFENPASDGPKSIRRFADRYMGCCDGHATDRLLALTGLNRDNEK